MSDAKSRFFAVAKRPLRTESIVISGQSFTIRELSESDAADLEVKMQSKDGKFDFTRHRRLMVAACLVDETGKRIIEDPDELKDCPKVVIGQIYDRCLNLSNYSALEVEDLAKKIHRSQRLKIAFRLALQWGILDVQDWLKSLPEGALDQWIAFDKVEPMGEQWQQTASILQAVNLPLFARSGQPLPEVDDFMPSRYKRPKKRLASQLFQSADAVKRQAEQAKSMFWKGNK